ncbi:hypothetical protein NFI96_014606 [Prochilodus magdalenae]|nr:hypothetical protein NFI96_014606 [Prochilodus magdalenae]
MPVSRKFSPPLHTQPVPPLSLLLLNKAPNSMRPGSSDWGSPQPKPGMGPKVKGQRRARSPRAPDPGDEEKDGGDEAKGAANRARKKGYRPPDVRTIFEEQIQDPRVTKERGEGHVFIRLCMSFLELCDVCCTPISQDGEVCAGKSHVGVMHKTPMGFFRYGWNLIVSMSGVMGLGRGFGRTLRRLAALLYRFPKAMQRSGRLELSLLWKTSGCKYTCHAQCHDRVTLDCHPNRSCNDSSLSPLTQDHLNNNQSSHSVSLLLSNVKDSEEKEEEEEVKEKEEDEEKEKDEEEEEEDGEAKDEEEEDGADEEEDEVKKEEEEEEEEGEEEEDINCFFTATYCFREFQISSGSGQKCPDLKNNERNLQMCNWTVWMTLDNLGMFPTFDPEAVLGYGMHAFSRVCGPLYYHTGYKLWSSVKNQAAEKVLMLKRICEDVKLYPLQMTWTSTMSSGYSSLEEDSEEYFFTARTSFFKKPLGKLSEQKDVEKEKELRTHLSVEEIRRKIELYNSATRDHLKMTLNHNGMYTGFIKVQLELRRPITVTGGRVGGVKTQEAFYLPPGSVNTLHISSSNTVRQVIEALLHKFTVADNPAKFALYKRFHREDHVSICKLAEGEHPLLLRLLAGPNPDTLSFVLREQQTGEVMWEAFSIPELQNFLRFLEKEEQDQVHMITARYNTYREKLEEALQAASSPD